MTRRPFLTAGLLCCFASFAASGGTAEVEADIYSVGVAEVDITPGHPIRLNGFGFRREESEGVNHKIHARALAIRHGDADPVVLMTVDVLGIPADVRAELAKRLTVKANLPSDSLAVTATHTHCGPMLRGANPTIFGMPIPEDHLKYIDAYTDVFIDKLEQAALAALNNQRPAKLFRGVGTVGFARNRRTAGGPTDHDLPVLVAKDTESNQVVAVYVTYACHCVTLSHNRIGGDWAGYAAEAIRDRFPGAVGLVSIGCGADQNPDTGVTGDNVEAAQVQGRRIADEVKRMLGGYLAPVSGGIVRKMKTLTLPLADPPTREEWRERAKRDDAVGYHARVQLAKLDRGEQLPAAVEYPVQTWAFGNSLAMVHLPGEVVVDYATRLKQELDSDRVWLTAYANHNPCYIPSERILKEGGYEGGGAMIYYDLPGPFKPGLEDAIVGEVHAQLGDRFLPPFDPDKIDDGKPLSPQQSARAIRVGEGLTVDLVAAEPLVSDPVAIASGPDGKLWVAEMIDYPDGKAGNFEPGGRVRFLQDDDGDGIFDRANTFLDGLPFPTGVLPWRDGVLICAAPDILYAEDGDGDGRAEVVKKLYSGFGTDNYQARVNGLAYGLDGWVYGSCGLFGGQILSHKTGKTLALGDRDFRIKPDTGEIEPATGRTQQGRVCNDWGDWFGCDNSNLAWHYPLADHYLSRNPHFPPPGSVVNLPAGPDPNRLYPIHTPQLFKLSGPAGRTTAACGIGVYRDDRLGAEFTGNVFTCEPVNLVVHRRQLRANGATFTGVRADGETDREFLASTDEWFRPVQAVTGPDGGLWVADMYRFVIEHPRWIPADDVARLDLRAGSGMGRIYRVRPTETPSRRLPRLDTLDTDGLVAALDSANGWQRDMATELLAWRGDTSAVPLLVKTASGSTRAEARLHALVTLDRLGGLSAGLVRAALRDPHPGVRRHAVRLAEPSLAKDGELGPSVAALVGDPDARVRQQVGYSLGYWADPKAGVALAGLAVRDAEEPFVIAAVVSSLTRDNFAGVVGHLDTPKIADTPLLPHLIATAAGIGDESALTSLLHLVTRPGQSGYEPWQFAAVDSALDALDRVAEGKPRPPSVAAVVEAARSVAAEATTEPASRAAAIGLLGRELEKRADDIATLAAILIPQTPVSVQTAAVAALGRTADGRAADALLAGWGGYTPALRERVIDELFSRQDWVRKLLVAIADGKASASAVSAARRHRLLTHADAAIRSAAEGIFAGPTNPDRGRVIAEYRPGGRAVGNPARGKQVFAKSCATCHRLESTGHEVGPDLAALANKSAEYLLTEILDPNRNLDSRYTEYLANTADGLTVTGMLADESAAAIRLRQPDGKEATLLRADLDSLSSTGRSLMPEGLEKEIPPPAMVDLIAYLGTAGTPPKSIAGNSPTLVRPTNGRLTLRAAVCEIHGGDIVFEQQFGNVGWWSGPNDHVVWQFRLDAAGTFDVYMEFACDPSVAGNRFALDGGEPTLRGEVPSTGGWSEYRREKIGTVELPAGEGRLTFRPDAEMVRGALIDLRTLYLVPEGESPPK